MRKRLKGRIHYSPGLGYGVLLSGVSSALSVGFFFKLELWNLPTVLVVVIIVILCVAYAVCFVLGKDIFDFTKKKYLRRYKDDKTAQHYAEITEAVIILMIGLLGAIVPAINEARNDSKDNSSSIYESIDGWD